MIKALVLLRTPFQAWIVERVLKQEDIAQFDLVYFTQDDSAEDRYYFGRLASRSGMTAYCHVRRKQPDILNHLYFRWKIRLWFRPANYDFVLLSSIDALVPNALATSKDAALITFDDGTANINKQCVYYVENQGLRVRFYRWMLGAASLVEIKLKIRRHYTLYDKNENIVESERLRFLPLWFGEHKVPEDAPVISFFIGEPFEEVYDVRQLAKLGEYIKCFDLDYYVKHPRETSVIAEHVVQLDKAGKIAEDAIINSARCSRIHLIGCFSTVMFNMQGYAWKRTMILFSDDPTTLSMSELARNAGCEVVLI
jgi:hypothetical protein